MSGIDKITDKISEDAKTYEAVALSQAEREVAEIADDYRSRAEYNSRIIIEKGKKSAESVLSRANSSAALIKRNTILQMKSSLVDDVFKTAAQRLASMPDELTHEFLLCVLLKAAREGNGEVVLNKEDRDKYGAKLVADANRKAKEAGRKCEFFLSEQTAQIIGGLILKYGIMDINCAFDKMVDAKKTKLEPHVMNILFKNKK